MEIEQTITNWIVRTLSKLEDERNNSSELIYDFCNSSLRIARVYGEAIFVLLDKDFRLPTKALLRPLAELATRVAWCLHSEFHGKNNVELRICSWHRLSNRKYMNNMDKFFSVIQNKTWLKEQLQEAGKEKKQYEQTTIPEMPEEFADVCKQLSGEINKSLRPRLYLQFHHAIHPDAYLQRIFIDNPNLKDTDEVVNTLYHYCLINMFWLMWAIYTHWKWPLDEVLKEYEAACNAIGYSVDVESIINKNTDK